MIINGREVQVPADARVSLLDFLREHLELYATKKGRLGGWLLVNVFPAIDRWLIPRSGGRLKVALGQPILLLHTRGGKSGQARP